MPQSFYISTAIHYVNDDPHIGHMYENVVADVVARHRRRMGDQVWFLTGTDEHGQKIERSAAKEGIRPIELADRVVKTHHALWKKLDISHDDFIRTTEDRHRLGVLELIRRIEKRDPDDIYAGEHSGWYCQSEETFIPENQVRDKRDESGHPVEWTTESNYFFRLSRFTQPLLDHYAANPGFIYPPTRMNEIRSFVEQGLKDLSISRTSIKWGIPWPGKPEHVIYVWMDALTNYLSDLTTDGKLEGPDVDKYFPQAIHVIGKDILRIGDSMRVSPRVVARLGDRPGRSKRVGCGNEGERADVSASLGNAAARPRGWAVQRHVTTTAVRRGRAVRERVRAVGSRRRCRGARGSAQ